MGLGMEFLFSNLFEEGFERAVAGLLHLAVDVSAELTHGLEQSPVVVHEAAAELGRMSGKQPEPGCRENDALLF